jgi:hypothetical protein
VIDANKVVHGDTGSIGFGPDPKPAFSVFGAIGDGHRVLAADHRGAAVLAVGDGGITRVADLPLRGPRTPPVNWQPGILRDSQGRSWVRVVTGAPPRPTSQAIDAAGNIVASYPGWLMLEDRHKGLWFKITGEGEASIVRVDAGGTQARLVVPRLAAMANFAEAADGTIWTLTTSDLVQIRLEGRGLLIARRYPTAVFDTDSLWFDHEDRLWMIHTVIAGMDLPRTELICFATGKPPVASDEPPRPHAGKTSLAAMDDAGEFPTREEQRDRHPFLFNGFHGMGASDPPITVPTGEELYPWRCPQFPDLPAGRLVFTYEPVHLLFYLDAAGSRLLEPGVPFVSSREAFVLYGKLRKEKIAEGDAAFHVYNLPYRQPAAEKQDTRRQ